MHHPRKTRWQRVLRAAIKRGDHISVEVLAEEMTNEEANAYEVRLIAKFGRLDLGTGTLYNRTADGDGLTSEDAIRVFSNPKTRRKLIRARRRTARDAALRAKLSAAQRRSWVDPTTGPPSPRDRPRDARPSRCTREASGDPAITNQRPDVKARRSEATKAMYRDPAYRVKFSEALRRVDARPERKEQMRQHTSERNKDPVFTRHRLEGIQRH